MIYPGATLAVLGGGQLGRMFTLAAHSMGYQVWVLDPSTHSPAGSIAERHLQAAYTDKDALSEIATHCAAVTTEFENVPASSLEYLQQFIPVRPSASALGIARDRILEKTFIQQAGLLTTPFQVITSADDCIAACEKMTLPALMKTAQMGYDGKGQALISSTDDALKHFESQQNADCILEQLVDIKQEISVILARNPDGVTQCFPVGENIHVNGILDTTIVPANINPEIEQQAITMAISLATTLDYVGVLAVEFFLSQDNQLLINEMAPRPHNSGHYTLDACITDQFEQQVRTLCELQPGATELLKPVVMLNILGDIWRNKKEPDWNTVYQHLAAKLHLYGKDKPLSGRKMGHINILADRLSEAMETSEQIRQQLGF